MIDDAPDAANADTGPAGPSVPLDIVLTTVTGLVLGGVTGHWVWTLYPPVRGQVSPIVEVIVGSALVTLLLYGVIARVRHLRAADWLMVGYVVALVVFAGFCITEEAITFVRHHTASQIGISVA